MHWSTFLAFCALDTVLCLVPGPAVMAVVGAALSRDRAGRATALGILTGNAIYFAVSALGVASVLLASHRAFTVVKWCGAAYLAYLGLRGILSKHEDAGAAPQQTAPVRHARGWASGTVTQLANPKALVFFAAIVPQFIDPGSRLALQIVVLGIASLVIEFAVLSGYIAAADRVGKGTLPPRLRAVVQRIGGFFLLGVAAAVVREA